jgi:hypothetical protein
MNKPAKCASVEESSHNGSWIAGEVAGCEFEDTRLGKRLSSLLQKLGGSIGSTVPLACQDWANTKAAYRFFDNDRVDEQAILSGHFQATRDRAHASSGAVLILHDTTEFTYMREQPELVGLSGGAVRNRGQATKGTACGVLMHSSLAVTVEGLPLGLCAIKFWSRSERKADATTKKIKRERIPIEEKESIRWLQNLRQSSELIAQAERCVHIGDRESDIYELFCTAQELGTHFLVRSCTDRRAGEGDHTIADEMAEVRVQGLHRVEFRDGRGDRCEALLEIRYRRVKVLPPVRKQNSHPGLELTIVYAQERNAPADRAPLEWKLITNLAVRSKAEALEKIDWYAMRWKIETFHKILKSGCKAEDSRLRTAERLTNLISIYCILSWRIFWMTMLNRTAPDSRPTLGFTDVEIAVLDRLSSLPRPRARAVDILPRTLGHYLTALAKLGGYLARKNDPPPGNTVIWRGLTRLTDIVFGMQIAQEVVGN